MGWNWHYSLTKCSINKSETLVADSTERELNTRNDSKLREFTVVDENVVMVASCSLKPILATCEAISLAIFRLALNPDRLIDCRATATAL